MPRDTITMSPAEKYCAHYGHSIHDLKDVRRDGGFITAKTWSESAKAWMLITVGMDGSLIDAKHCERSE